MRGCHISSKCPTFFAQSNFGDKCQWNYSCNRMLTEKCKCGKKAEYEKEENIWWNSRSPCCWLHRISRGRAVDATGRALLQLRYSPHFNFVELNSTLVVLQCPFFYRRLVTHSACESWADWRPPFLWRKNFRRRTRWPQRRGNDRYTPEAPGMWRRLLLGV